MHTSHPIFIAWLTVLAALRLSPMVAGQQQPPAAKTPPAAEVKLPQPEDPAVAAILETKPSTPAQWARAAKILADLQRPDLAKSFLKQILDAKLAPKQLAALADEYGSAMFIRMASREDLAPEARLLADTVLNAVAQQRRDPQVIAANIKQLSDPSPEVRYRAMTQLREARDAAVAPMVAVLADPARAAEHANVRAALLRIGPDAFGSLTAILQADDPRLVVEAIRVLAKLDVPDKSLFLLAPYASPESDEAVRRAAREALEEVATQAPSPHEAAELLAERARRYFERQEPIQEYLPGQVEVWTWDTQKKQPAVVLRPTDDASLAMAVRFAREAFSVTPGDEPIRVLYLATALEQAKYAEGLASPLRQATSAPLSLAATLGPDLVEHVLRYAIQTGHAPAATAAARLLGDIGDPDKLLYQGPDPAPLVQATRHPDRRLRLAAAESILKLMPVRPFPGSSYVPEALSFLAATGGRPRALVAGPMTAESMRVGGYLAEMGYEIDTAATGRALIQAALGSPDYELILVDSALLAPTVDFVLQELRRDCRTARLPVGVIARDERTERARHLVRNDPLAIALPRPHSKESVEWQVGQLLQLLGRERVSHAERQQQAAFALELLALISGNESQMQIYDLKGAQKAALAALYVPGFTVPAARLLGNLGTAEAQTALIELASREAQPLEGRKAAVESFVKAVQKNGILLTTNQILRQYDRYNQSAPLGADTQQILGAILDCIEAPSRPLRSADGAAPVPRSEAATRK